MYCAVKAGIGIAHMPCYEADSIADPEVIKLPHSVARSDWGVWVLSQWISEKLPVFSCAANF
jgi:hypothetical protein